MRAPTPKMQTENGSATELDGVPWKADSGQVACPLIFDSDNVLEGVAWIRGSPDDWPLDANKRGCRRKR